MQKLFYNSWHFIKLFISSYILYLAIAKSNMAQICIWYTTKLTPIKISCIRKDRDIVIKQSNTLIEQSDTKIKYSIITVNSKINETLTKTTKLASDVLINVNALRCNLRAFFQNFLWYTPAPLKVN